MQLPLPVTLPVDENFDSFVNTGNEEVVSVLEQIADALPHWREAPELGPLASLQLPLLTLLGSTAIGKSHLLFATCHVASAPPKLWPTKCTHPVTLSRIFAVTNSCRPGFMV